MIREMDEEKSGEESFRINAKQAIRTRRLAPFKQDAIIAYSLELENHQDPNHQNHIYTAITSHFSLNHLGRRKHKNNIKMIAAAFLTDH